MYRKYKEPYGSSKLPEVLPPPVIQTEHIKNKAPDKPSPGLFKLDFLSDITKNFKFDDILLIALILLLLQEQSDDYILIIILGYVFLSEYDFF